MDINQYQKEYALAIKSTFKHPIEGDLKFGRVLDSTWGRSLIIMDSTNAIAAEAGELANIGKKIYRFKTFGYKPEKYGQVNEEDLKEEFSDVLSNCFDMACRMGWSVEEILLQKLKEKQSNGQK